WRRGVHHGLDAARVWRGTRRAELHHAADAQAVAERGAGDALNGEIDRVGRHDLGLHAEAVAAPCLHELAYTELAAELAQPRSGGDDGLVGTHVLARRDDHLDALDAEVVDVGDVHAGQDLAAALAHGFSEGLHVNGRVDVVLPGNADAMGHRPADGRLDGAQLIA